MPGVRSQEPEVRSKIPQPLTPSPETQPSNRFAFASYTARISTPGSLSTCRRRTIQFSKIVECRQPACAGFDLFQPDSSGFRRFHQDAGFGSALLPSRKTELNTLVASSEQTLSRFIVRPSSSGQRQNSLNRMLRQICFELKGSKQAGGSCGENPRASNPYPKAFRVSTSWWLQPGRCGCLRLHLRAGNQEY
jgi:hypothetical protein